MVDLSSFNIGASLPALALALGACVVLVLDLYTPKDQKQRTAFLCLIGLGVSLVLALASFNTNQTAFKGMFRADSFSALVDVVALVTAAISILISRDYMARTKIERGEFYPLVLLSAAGAMFMGAAGDLIVVLISLELLSIPLYVMAGMRRPDVRSEESAMKYFLMGAFASGFFVYGMAMVYGATGTTNLEAIFNSVQAGDLASPFLLLLGTGLILVALGFKVAAVPFHAWTPDVYQGSPTAVTAYMSVIAKVGGFGALLRVMTLALPSFLVGTVTLDPGQSVTVHAAWQDTVSIIAALTMLFGNFVAISQKDIKRMLAYSSIAHAGYLLMAVAAAGTFQITANDAGVQSVQLVIASEALQGALIYLVAYAFTNIGAFSVAIAVEKDDASGTLIDDFAGLGRTHPMYAGAMSVFLFSLVGIPLTGGFVGKWFVFSSSLSAGLTLLALIGVLTSVISAYYYLRVIVKMWLEVGEGDAKPSQWLSIGVGVCAVATLLIGIAPPLVSGLAQSVTAIVLR